MSRPLRRYALVAKPCRQRRDHDAIERAMVERQPGLVCGVAADLLDLAGRGALDLDKHPSRHAVGLARAVLDKAGGCYQRAVEALRSAEAAACFRA